MPQLNLVALVHQLHTSIVDFEDVLGSEPWKMYPLNPIEGCVEIEWVASCDFALPIPIETGSLNVDCA